MIDLLTLREWFMKLQTSMVKVILSQESDKSDESKQFENQSGDKN